MFPLSFPKKHLSERILARYGKLIGAIRVIFDTYKYIAHALDAKALGRCEVCRY